MFGRILSRLCKDVRIVYGLNVVGLWVDIQGELCYRDILVYGLVEYMDYDIGSLGDWYGVDGRELGRRDMDFRIGLRMGVGDYWDKFFWCGIGFFFCVYGILVEMCNKVSVENVIKTVCLIKED